MSATPSPSRVAALAYHEVTDDGRAAGFQRPGARPYKHDRAAFARHLDAIAQGPRAPELVTDLDLARPGRHLLLTFDDGGKSAVHIGDTLAARGWKGHFFIVTGLIGTRTFLSAQSIRYLRSAGHVLGSHSETHPDIFREQPFERMVEEWRVSRDTLAQLLGEPCRSASVPGGDSSPLVLRSAAAAGLAYLFTSEPVLEPEQVDGCWILGRFVPKVTTSARRIGELAQFRGWRRARLVRELKGLVRTALPGLYRQYVDHTTRPTGS
jgi:peptidoglycan/xylan/chitin deacetylase (PgdA/CDA1 family)